MFVLIRVRDSSIQNNMKAEAERQHHFSFINYNTYMTGSFTQREHLSQD